MMVEETKKEENWLRRKKCNEVEELMRVRRWRR